LMAPTHIVQLDVARARTDLGHDVQPIAPNVAPAAFTPGSAPQACTRLKDHRLGLIVWLTPPKAGRPCHRRTHPIHSWAGDHCAGVRTFWARCAMRRRRTVRCLCFGWMPIAGFPPREKAPNSGQSGMAPPLGYVTGPRKLRTLSLICPIALPACNIAIMGCRCRRRRRRAALARKTTIQRVDMARDDEKPRHPPAH